MSTKERILELFESNKGLYFSGEEIARKFCVSRAAVWKAVKSLREEGYVICAVTNKGYSLSEKTDILSQQGIIKYLKEEYKKMEIEVLSSVDSTNVYARKKAEQGFKEGYMVISNEQTKGRGRYQREFFSPYGTGIYMSLLLRPQHYSASQAVRITTMAAVAMCEAIEEVSDERAEIKWVNDIFIRGKKVCGILTEASFGMESGLLEYAVLGIGINVYEPEDGFLGEIKDIAGSIFTDTREDVKNRLVASFIHHFMKYYQDEDKEDYIKKYQSRSLVVGKEITVISGTQERNAFVHGIDDACRLLIEYDNEEKDCLSYGEIRIRVRNTKESE